MSTKDPQPTTKTMYAFKKETCDSCGRVIRPGEPMHVDLLVPGRGHCDGCGKSLRYHRKKALERGEDPPRTIEDSDRRLENRNVASN